jgi:hypothetical protein
MNSLDFAPKVLLVGDLNRLFQLVTEEMGEGFALGTMVGFLYYNRQEEMTETDLFLFRYSGKATAGRDYGELLASVVEEHSSYRVIELQKTLIAVQFRLTT